MANISLETKINICRVALVIGTIIFCYGVSGAIYTLVSNHQHVSFSFNTGPPVLVAIIPGTSNLTAANFTLRVFNTKSSSLSNLFVNITLDSHPNSTGGGFVLNTVSALNQTNPQWIVDGPFSLGTNQQTSFFFTFRYSGIFGFYDIDASVVQLG